MSLQDELQSKTCAWLSVASFVSAWGTILLIFTPVLPYLFLPTGITFFLSLFGVVTNQGRPASRLLAFMSMALAILLGLFVGLTLFINASHRTR